jgi:hypothetical protein
MSHPSARNEVHQQIIDALSWVLSLKSAFVSMIEIIEQEHDAIRVADLSGLEKIATHKTEVAQEIEMAVKAINELQALIADHYQTELASETIPANLTGMVAMLSHIVNARQLNGNREVERDLTTLEEAVEECIQMRMEYAPKLQQNKYLVEKMLRIHQENYRFWQRVVSESEATYNSQGSRRDEGRTSLVKVQV